MAFYITNDAQTVADNGSVVFDTTVIRDTSGNVRHSDGTSTFLLSGGPNRRRTCCCQGDPCKQYPVNFGANIAIPTDGGTVSPISLAIAVNGAVVPASTMIVTPAAVGEFFNVSREMPVAIFCGCCQSVSIVNTSGQPITVQNATIEI